MALLLLGACGSEPTADQQAWLDLQHRAPPAAPASETRAAPMRVALRFDPRDEPAPGAQPALVIARSPLAEVALGRSEPASDRPIEWRADSDRGALDRLHSGTAELALVCRALSTRDRDAGIVATPVGAITFVLLVPESQPLRSLPPDAVRALLSGTMRDWRMAGGPPLPVTLLLEAEPVLEERAAALLLPGDRIAADARRLPDAASVVTEVAGTPGALGLLDLASYERCARSGARLLAVDLIRPGPGYRFVVPLLLASRGSSPVVPRLVPRLRDLAQARGRAQPR
jgi:hypothetical protein